jgi:hypothetical protein
MAEAMGGSVAASDSTLGGLRIAVRLQAADRAPVEPTASSPSLSPAVPPAGSPVVPAHP